MVSAEMSLRRIGLTALFVVWLSVQPFALGISPAWGTILPHDHLVLGIMTPAAWAQHLLEHQRQAQQFSNWDCNATRVPATNGVVASLPDTSGATSIFSFLTATLHNPAIEIPAPAIPTVRWGASACYVFNITYAPPKPPPNL